jgi:hypothetical protein
VLSRSFNDMLSLSSNTLYGVALVAKVDPSNPDAIALALADPYIQNDAAFLTANPGYSLEFSDGIDNVPIAATPVPPALPMFGAALLALGAFAWRRRERASDLNAPGIAVP